MESCRLKLKYGRDSIPLSYNMPAVEMHVKNEEEKQMLEYALLICDVKNKYLLDRNVSDEFLVSHIRGEYQYLSATYQTKNWNFNTGYTKLNGSVYPLRGQMNGANPDLEFTLLEEPGDSDEQCNSLSNGFKIYVQHPADMPQSSLYYYAAIPGQVTSLALKFSILNTSSSLQNYDHDQRQCYFTWDRPLDYFKIYTPSNCWLECLSKFTYKRCSCVWFHMPHKNSSELCTAQKRACVTKAHDELASGSADEEMGETCNCLPSCTSVQYDAEILKTTFDFKKDFIANKRSYNKSKGTQDFRFLDKYNFSKVEMYFKEPRFVSMRRSELFGLTDFLANCGGLLGLFLGFSFLSLIEIFYFCTLSSNPDEEIKPPPQFDSDDSSDAPSLNSSLEPSQTDDLQGIKVVVHTAIYWSCSHRLETGVTGDLGMVGKMKQQRRKRQKLLIIDLFLDFAKNTTLHGLRYITQGVTIAEKIFWIITFLISLGICFWSIEQVWYKWRHSPVIVSFNERMIPVDEIPFPSVTICPQWKCKSSEYNYHKQYNKFYPSIFSWEDEPNITNTDIDEKQMLEDATLICDPYQRHLLNRSVSDKSLVDHIRQAGQRSRKTDPKCVESNWSMKELLKGDLPLALKRKLVYGNDKNRDLIKFLSLQAEYKYHDASEETKDWNFTSGYSSNDSVYPFRGQENGEKPDLIMVLLQNSSDTDEQCNNIANGFKIYIQHPADMPQSSLYYYAVIPGQVTSLALKFNIINTSSSLENYEYEQRQCYFPEDHPLDYFKIYTPSNCRLECLSKYTYKKCGCVRFHMPHNNSFELCPAMKRACVREAIGAPVRVDASLGAVRVTDFLANCGGLLGLFLGFSFLSLVEIFYFCTLRLELPECAEVEDLDEAEEGEAEEEPEQPAAVGQEVLTNSDWIERLASLVIAVTLTHTDSLRPSAFALARLGSDRQGYYETRKALFNSPYKFTPLLSSTVTLMVVVLLDNSTGSANCGCRVRRIIPAPAHRLRPRRTRDS
ncbi:hypothetical protein MSG28_003089 [Choristoneura fumiferana]|uniref:Uncharacterized protein n=1 Tax=Choristoneura fumiferana TaxID=7141 RepID=A0ACC0JKJ1_CHOFU|nr:hypothetical protein MSG28_003089 [Choristoneura fumiferana]